MEFIAGSAASLEYLRQRGVKSTIRRIRLVGPLADERAERALNHAYFSCGCEQGSIAVMTVLANSLVLGLLRGFDGALSWWRILLYLAVAALVGKAVGLAVARVRLRWLYSQLHSRCLQSGPTAGTV